MAQWYYAEGPGRNVGPLTTEELAACFRRGQLMLDSQVWREGMAQWQPLRSVAAELGLDATASATAPMPPPLPGAPGHASPRPGAPAIAPAPRGMSRGTIILIICLAAIIPMLAILGILAAIAIPAFVTYIRRAKTVEATENVSKMFDGAASYYARERAATGLTGSIQVHCTVVNGKDTLPDPNDQKQPGNPSQTTFRFQDGFNPVNGLGFNVDNGYYKYTLTGPGDGCSRAKETELYKLGAIGDLDADNVDSLFELAAGSNPDNELYHAKGFYIVNETE